MRIIVDVTDVDQCGRDTCTAAVHSGCRSASVFWAFSPQATGSLEKEICVNPPLSTNFLRDESGQDIVEYGLILAVLALFLVASMDHLTSTMSSFFNTVGNDL